MKDEVLLIHLVSQLNVYQCMIDITHCQCSEVNYVITGDRNNNEQQMLEQRLFFNGTTMSSSISGSTMLTSGVRGCFDQTVYVRVSCTMSTTLTCVLSYTNANRIILLTGLIVLQLMLT